jgi:hypothetical protein
VFVDLDGNGIINEDDKTRELGYTDDPQYIAGLNAGFAWKDFEFNMQWTGSWDVSRVISDVFRYPFLDRTTKDRGGLLRIHGIPTDRGSIMNIRAPLGPTDLLTTIRIALFMRKMRNICV